MADSPKVPLGNKPGKTNWIEKYGVLQPHATNWIYRAAEHLKGKGMDDGRAIATAKNAAAKMCATGDTNFPGIQQVNPGSKAEACAAVKKWDEGRAKAKAARVTESFYDDNAELCAWAEGRLTAARGLKATLDDRKAGRNAHRRATAGAIALVEGRTSVSLNDADPRFAKACDELAGYIELMEAVALLSQPPTETGGGPKTKVPKGLAGVLRRSDGAKSSGEVATLQVKLASAGYDVGAAGSDGLYGLRTERAVKKFQRDHGLRIDGVAGRHTIRVLGTAKEVGLTEALGRARTVELRRLPDGQFAPKGAGQILRPGDTVRVPHKGGKGTVTARVHTDYGQWWAQLNSGPDKGSLIDLNVTDGEAAVTARSRLKETAMNNSADGPDTGAMMKRLLGMKSGQSMKLGGGCMVKRVGSGWEIDGKSASSPGAAAKMIAAYSGPGDKKKVQETWDDAGYPESNLREASTGPAYSPQAREKATANGTALDDGSFPIRSVGELKKAIAAFGRAKDKGAAKAWIVKRAKALNATGSLPAGWA